METYQSKDYDTFISHEQNRVLTEANVVKLMKSMEEAGYIKNRPILVNKENIIFDGAHRLEAAKRLDISFWVQVDPSLEAKDIIHLNEQKPWQQVDYLNYWARGGNSHYVALETFLKKNEMSIMTFLRIIDTGDRKQVADRFRKGSYTYNKSKAALVEALWNQGKDIIALILNKSPENRRVCKAAYFKMSLLIFLSRQDVEYDRLLKNTEIRLALIRQCSGIEEYLRVWFEIYNYNSRNKLEIDTDWKQG